MNVVADVSALVSPLPESEPELDHGPPAVQLVELDELQLSVERLLYATGFGDAESEAVGAAHDEFDGAVAEHAPEQLIVPVLVTPHEFAADLHELP